MGLSEPLAVVLLGLESARKRDGKCFIKLKKKKLKEKQTEKRNNKKCHISANMRLKWLILSITPRKKNPGFDKLCCNFETDNNMVFA